MTDPRQLSSHTRIVFEFGPITIGVSSQDSSHLVWLEEFLSPQIKVAAAGEATTELRLRCDRDGWAELPAPTPDWPEIDVFQLDTQIVRLPFQESESALLAADLDRGVYYRVSRNRAAVELLTPENSRFPRVSLMRSVRELATLSIDDPSSFYLHTAAIETGDQGILIAGPKNAGKTSLLTYLLRGLEAKYIANDRALITLSGKPRVHGIPTIVSFRAESCEFFPQLKKAIRAKRLHYRLSQAEVQAESGPETGPPPHGRYVFSPAQYCSVLGVNQAAGCRPRAVLFPKRDENPGPLKLRRLSDKTASERLAECVYGAGTTPSPNRLFRTTSSSTAGGAEASRDLLRRLAEQVRCFDCRLGPQSYEHPASLETLRSLLN